MQKSRESFGGDVQVRFGPEGGLEQVFGGKTRYLSLKNGTARQLWAHTQLCVVGAGKRAWRCLVRLGMSCNLGRAASRLRPRVFAFANVSIADGAASGVLGTFGFFVGQKFGRCGKVSPGAPVAWVLPFLTLPTPRVKNTHMRYGRAGGSHLTHGAQKSNSPRSFWNAPEVRLSPTSSC